jgi:hypothetical protein
MKPVILVITLLLGFVSCNKIEGPGGTSAIRGTVKGSSFSAGRQEVTQVTCTAGIELEHGDYWILNTGDPSKQYYIYYSNPSWISNADPQLQGRIGIMVSFNYSDSNAEIAAQTQAAIAATAGTPFSSFVTNDIITLTDNSYIDVPDPDNGTTSFGIDVAMQGKAEESTNGISMANERVYIIYGDNEFAANDVRTDEAGRFSFEGLQKGNYRIYVLSKDPLNEGIYYRVQQEVSISAAKEIVETPLFNILY